MSALKLHLRQGSWFIVCGATGVVVDLAVLTLCVELLQLIPEVGYVISTVITGAYVFLFNRHFTFRKIGAGARQQAQRFAVTYVLTAIVHLGIAMGLYWLGMQYVVSKILATIATAVLNYALSHWFIFRD